MIEGGELEKVVAERYAGWRSAEAQALLGRGSSLAEISDAAVAAGIAPKPRSGRQERIENLINRFI